jgi:hypothetical protein
MKTSVVTVRVTCPKCRTRYEDKYMPAPAMPEANGIGLEYTDDCVVTSCPACDHMISAVVRITNAEEIKMKSGT